MPTTFRPARARGSTAVPPPAPRPTTATSQALTLMAIVIGAPGGAVIRRNLHAHLLVFGAGSQSRTGITDEVPSREILVAAVVRIAEHTFEHQPSRPIEKRARVCRGFARVDIGEHRVALFRRKIRQRRTLAGTRVGIDRGEAVEKRLALGLQLIAEPHSDRVLR